MRLGKIFFGMQLVEHRFFQTGDGPLFRADHIKDDDFIFARAQPAAGRIGGLRRADVPVAAEAMAVDPHIALAPVVQIQKRVAGLFQGKCAAPEFRRVATRQSIRWYCKP